MEYACSFTIAEYVFFAQERPSLTAMKRSTHILTAMKCTTLVTSKARLLSPNSKSVYVFKSILLAASPGLG